MRFPKINKEHIPRNRLVRTIVGLLLLIGGIFGFLPIVGFWMIPLGLIILSVDFPMVRRFSRRLAVWWGRKKNHALGGNGGTGGNGANGENNDRS